MPWGSSEHAASPLSQMPAWSPSNRICRKKKTNMFFSFPFALELGMSCVMDAWLFIRSYWKFVSVKRSSQSLWLEVGENNWYHFFPLASEFGINGVVDVLCFIRASWKSLYLPNASGQSLLLEFGENLVSLFLPYFGVWFKLCDECVIVCKGMLEVSICEMPVPKPFAQIWRKR